MHLKAFAPEFAQNQMDENLNSCRPTRNKFVRDLLR